MNIDKQAAKEILSPPGDTIQETIENIGMSQAELAERMGRPKEKVNALIKGKEPLTMRTAILLERVLNIPVGFWMERERRYREELARIEQHAFLESQIEWLSKFPVSELKKMGWLPNVRDKIKLAEELLKFFGIGSSIEWEKIYIQDSVSTSFKISLAQTNKPYALSAWIRIGELKSARKNLKPFDKNCFRKLLETIKKELIVIQPEDFQEKLEDMCAECGVAVLYTPCLSGAPVSGATWWRKGNPVIQLSGRYKTNDSFWFAFYHEAGHILKHGRKEIFLENVQGTPKDEQKEKEADQFARKTLFPEEAFKQLVLESPLSDDIIIQWADQYNIHPAVVVGQLQHWGCIGYNMKNHFKVKIELGEN